MDTEHRAYRDGDGRWVGGVASGLALHLGWSVGWTRVGFVVLAFAGGLGVIAYAAYWLVLPLGSRTQPAADRQLGLGPLLATGALLLGVALLASRLTRSLASLDVNGVLLVAVVAGGLGAAIIWRQADDEQGPASESGSVRWWRIGAGVALIATGWLLLIADAANPVQALRGALIGLVVAAGLGLLALPWIRRAWLTANHERAERIRALERAEVAAQVHDSVLQTLTLIRTHAADQDAVTSLARAEERRLRTWLYEPSPGAGTSLRSELVRLAADVEARRPVTVEAVAVGDCTVTPPLAAMLGATAEALLNAATHAGGAITLYSEVEPGQVSVYVRDRGPGFDPAAIPQDRLGVRESIIGRMERNGGTAQIRSTDAGTEVRLTMPHRDAA